VQQEFVEKQGVQGFLTYRFIPQGSSRSASACHSLLDVWLEEPAEQRATE
jgi:hypothetical protein